MKDIVNKTVLVGNVRMSLFSFIVAGSGILLGLITAFRVNIVVGLVLTASFFIAAYNLNCVIVGQCKIWAWVLFVVYVLDTILILGASAIPRMAMMSSPIGRKSKK